MNLPPATCKLSIILLKKKGQRPDNLCSNNRNQKTKVQSTGITNYKMSPGQSL